MIFIFNEYQFYALLVTLLASQLLIGLLVLLIWEMRLQYRNHQTTKRVLAEHYLENLDTIETDVPNYSDTSKWRTL